MKTAKQRHTTYTKEFKVTAVQLALHDNIQTQDVAAALDIHPFMLSRWKKEYRERTLRGKTHAQAREMEEKVIEHSQLRKLDKRIKALEKENEVLKKSIQFASNRSRTCSRS